MRPPFAYYGGKQGAASLIVGLFPPHRVYIEPFFGSGAVFFAKPPARHETINDLDGDVVTFFRVLRSRREELEEVCALTPYARAEFDAAAVDTHDDVERDRRFWVRVNQSFAKTGGSATGWSVTTGPTQSGPASVLSRQGRFRAVAERLMGVSIENCDAAELIDRMATSDTVIYADPPYLAETRRGRTRGRAEDYGVDMGTESAHQRLASALLETPATVFLSGYNSPLYDELYASWPRLEVPVRVHSSNPVTQRRGDRLEVIWSNRPLTTRPTQTTLSEVAR